MANDPLFPFGFGLTYGRFRLSNLSVSRGHPGGEGDGRRFASDVTNEGIRGAEETVFLFSHDKLASVARPVLELKGFAKIQLEPGAFGHHDAAA